jgi:hypothetical protein
MTDSELVAEYLRRYGVRKLPTGRAAGAGDLNTWALRRATGKSGVRAKARRQDKAALATAAKRSGLTLADQLSATVAWHSFRHG